MPQVVLFDVAFISFFFNYIQIYTLLFSTFTIIIQFLMMQIIKFSL